MPVVITGMHRSGTSMVTRLLNLCGLSLGDEQYLLSPTKDNPEGFWENAQFQSVNDEILASFGGGWDIPPVMQIGWETSPHLMAIADKAKLVIQEISQQHPVWGWKDPRNSLTLPFWKKLVLNPKIIVCIRNPFEVSHSLLRIGGASSVFSYNLWFTYNQQLLLSTNPEECIITHYDSFFRNPQSELRRLANFLELEVSDETIGTACQTISMDLRHNYGSITNLRMTNAPAQLLYLYRELCLRAGSMYKNSVSPEEAKFLEDITPTEEFVMASLQKHMGEIEIANTEKVWLQKEIVSLREERTREIERLQSTIQNIYASRSWRLIQIIQKISLFFIPLGSWREKIVKVIFKF